MLTIYHNPRCAKSRAGLTYLQAKGVSFEIIEYYRSPLTPVELEAILLKLDMQPQEVIRMQEKIYKEKYKGRELTDKEWVNAILNNPQLLQRPIVVSKYKAVIADPADKIEMLF